MTQPHSKVRRGMALTGLIAATFCAPLAGIFSQRMREFLHVLAQAETRARKNLGSESPVAQPFT